MHPALGEFLKNDEIDFHILSVLEDMAQPHNEGIAADSTLMLSPIFEALFDCNVIFKSKYGGVARLEHHLVTKNVA